jgi:hypothetical protein
VNVGNENPRSETGAAPVRGVTLVGAVLGLEGSRRSWTAALLTSMLCGPSFSLHPSLLHEFLSPQSRSIQLAFRERTFLSLDYESRRF